MFKRLFCLVCIFSSLILSQTNGGDMYLDPAVGYIVLGSTAPDGTAPTLTTSGNKTDYIGFIYNGVDSKYDCVAQRMNF